MHKHNFFDHLIIYNLISGDMQEANSNAISLWANVPPFFVGFVLMPIALNSLIHLVGDIVNEFLPVSDSRGSKLTP